ncbi:MAG: FtsX-like permease family protein [Lachnospiraceae bacterium]|nr:FtsX-like permease family protein [Lachnospiraceae bacterium]
MKKRQMYIRMITASLLRRRSRMVIALLAIAIGATILSGLVTIYIDVPRQMGAQFRSYGANMILTANEGTMDDAAIGKALSYIPDEILTGAVSYRYENVRINDRPVMAVAVDMEGAKKTSPFWMVDGAWPQNPGEIMIGKKVASTFLFRIGQQMNCIVTPDTEETDDGRIIENEVSFTVTGILDTGGKEEDYVFMLPRDMETLTGEKNTYSICELSVAATAAQLSDIEKSITDNADGIKAKLVKRVTSSETTVLSKLQALVFLVTVVVLALTMICVATTMTAVVAERRKEIGLRKALGASDGSIIAEFMGEGLVLGAVGGLLGAFLGFIFAQAVSTSVFNSSITLMPWLVPVTITASVLVTGIACMLPIRSATEVDPALVLKGE